MKVSDFWASNRYVFVDHEHIIHLFKIGSRTSTLCRNWWVPDGAWSQFQPTTCIACIVAQKFPCNLACAECMGCNVCDPAVPL